MRYAFLLLVLGLTATTAIAGPIDDLIDDPAAARDFDYCAWHFGGGSDEQLPDLESMLDAEDADGNRMQGAALADAGVKIAQAAKDERSCKRALDKGRKAFDKAWKKSLSQHMKMAGKSDSDDAEIAAVQQRIGELWARDQAARRVYIGARTEDKQGAAFWNSRLAYAEATAADDASTRTLRELMERYDWIDSHRFGKRISQHAWLLAQHADDTPDLQAEALKRMEPYLENDGVRKQDYAYLWDRVAVNHDRKQRYGTQPDWKCEGGTMKLRPMEDPENVDARRAEMDLGPVQDALDEMNRSVCGG